MSTSSTVKFYSGYYTGGKPTVLSANPFDVAQDLSTGNLWQYTGATWVAPSWQTSITFWLGSGDSVCARLNSEDTRIPDTIQVYYGTDDQVPAELALSSDDVAIHHNVGNYNLAVNVLRQDVTTDTVVDVPFPEGYIISTDDGNWTILKNFTKCVGYDYATVSLAWTTTADGQGPQSVDYVTSSGATIIASAVVSGALVEYPTSSAVEQMISSGATISGALISGSAINTTVNSNNLQLVDSGFVVIVPHENIILRQGIDESDDDGYRQITIDNNNNISLFANKLEFDDSESGYYYSANINVSTKGILANTNGSINLATTYLADDGETVASNTFSMSRDVLNMGCNDPDLGEWLVSFSTQAITLSINDNGIFVGVGSVLINTPLYVSSRLVLQNDFSNATLEVTDAGGVTLNSEAIATQPWVQSQISDISAGITSADAANIASSVISSGGYVDSQYVTNSIESAGETYGYITSGTADDLSSNTAILALLSGGTAPLAVVSASGALLSNTAIDTQIGPYRITATSGGVVVSGGGAQLQVSSGAVTALASSYDEESETSQFMALNLTSGAIVASGARGESVTLSSGKVSAGVADAEEHSARVTVTSSGVVITAADATNIADVIVTPGAVNVAGNDGGDGVWLTVNSRPVLTELATSTDTTTTSASIDVLSGGTSYVFTQPLTSLSIASVVNTTVEDRLQFTLASGGQVTFPASCGLCPSGLTFEGGKDYLVAVMGGNVVAAEYQPGV